MSIYLYRRCSCKKTGAADCAHPWWFKFTHDGKTFQVTTRISNKKEAGRVAKVRRDAMIAELSGAPSDAPKQAAATVAKTITLQQLAERYLPFYGAHFPNSIGNARIAVEHFVRVVGGETLLRDVSAATVEGFRAVRITEKTRRGTLVARSTVRVETNTVRGMFRQAEIWFKGIASPWAPVITPDGRKIDSLEAWSVDEKEVQVLTPDELRRCFAELPAPYNLFCEITYRVLPRISEVCGLTRDAVGFATDRDGQRIGTLSRRLKGGKVKRVGIPVALAERLVAQITSDDQVLLFPKHASSTSVGTEFTRLFRALGIKTSHHAFRHTGITRMLDAGVSTNAIKDLAGWGSLHQLARYGHVSDAEMQRAAMINVVAPTAAAVGGVAPCRARRRLTRTRRRRRTGFPRAPFFVWSRLKCRRPIAPPSPVDLHCLRAHRRAGALAAARRRARAHRRRLPRAARAARSRARARDRDFAPLQRHRDATTTHTHTCATLRARLHAGQSASVAENLRARGVRESVHARVHARVLREARGSSEEQRGDVVSRRRRRAHRRIAPRLTSGERRIASGNALPPILKFGLRVIAEQENRSLSWVVEQILLDWARDDTRLHSLLGGHAVEYVERKSPEPDAETVSVKEAIAIVAKKVGADVMGILIPPLDASPVYVVPATPPAFTLAELQGFVGGYIEAVALPWRTRTGFNGDGEPEPLIMFVNEDGKRLGLARNGFATALAHGVIDPGDVIVGTAIVCTLQEAGQDPKGDEHHEARNRYRLENDRRANHPRRRQRHDPHVARRRARRRAAQASAAADGEGSTKDHGTFEASTIISSRTGESMVNLYIDGRCNAAGAAARRARFAAILTGVIEAVDERRTAVSLPARQDRSAR